MATAATAVAGAGAGAAATTVGGTAESHAAGAGGAAAVAAKPRLMILKMVLENFKSYGGVKEIGPFHKSFSSVVGPNGSGKSNVIDAMLFVFGKKASKMRLNKVSELIHKSAEYPDLESCRVSVYFQDIVDDGSEDGYAVVAGSQFIVTRTALRNNTSRYYVNASPSSFTEVTALLKGRGIDLDNNRFLILQGEVEQISMMKPKAPTPGDDGLLEYLEDIIGVRHYVAAIEEAEKVVDALNTDRTEKLNRVKVVEKERAALESAKLEAEALLLKEREISRQTGVLLQRQLADASKALTDAEARHETLKTQAVAAKEKAAAGRVQLAEVQARVAAATASAEEASGRVAAATAAFAAAEKQDIALKENQAHAVRTVKKAEEVVAKESTAGAEALAMMERLKASLPTLEASRVQLEGDKAREEAAYDEVLMSLRGETDTLRVAMEVKQAELRPLAEAMAEVSAQLETARQEERLLRERLEAGGKEVSTMKASLAKVEAEAVAKVADMALAQKEVAALEAKQAELTAAVAAISAQEAEASASLRAAREKLEEGKAALASDDVKSDVERQLAAAARKGGPLAGSGFLGRLGGLGAIDGKYDVAISTACGALSWLVTETADGAQACVDYLRSHGLGRAKFIILDKVTPAAAAVMDARFDAPEGVPRLFDLVRPKEARYRAAFYYALRNTLVATDMDQAVRVGYVGGVATHRVVTVAGELIDTSGTMSGGGKTAKKGGMAASLSTVSVEEVAEAERACAAATALLAEIRARKAAATAELRELERALPKAATRIVKLQMEAASMTKTRDEMAARLAVAQSAATGGGASHAEDAAALTAVAARLVDLQRRHTSLTPDVAAVEVQVAALQRQILEVGGEKVRRAKARCDRASEGVEEVVRTLTKGRADLKAAEKTVERVKKAIEKAAADAQEAKASLLAFKGQLAAIEDAAMAALTDKKAADVDRAAADKLLSAARGEAAALEREVRSAVEAEKELSSAFAELDTALIAHRRRAGMLRDKLASLAEEYRARMIEYAAELAADAAEPPAAAAAPARIIDSDGAIESKDDGDAVMATSSSHARGVGAPAAVDAAAALALLPPSEPAELPMLTPAQLERISVSECTVALSALEGARDALGKKANMAAIEEYRRKDRDYLRRVAELDAITTARDAARRQWEGLRKRRLEEFMAGFTVISLRLKEMYQMITLGGDAELELVDSCDPFSEGILFQVRPPKKSWKHIANLSGGEKTLSSLALVFALHHYKPTPLYVMDEIDAALDFKNVSIVANYIKERTRDAQFVIISLRNNMFELADRLVGIYKTADVTKSVTINPKKIAAECGLVMAEVPAATAVAAVAVPGTTDGAATAAKAVPATAGAAAAGAGSMLSSSGI